MATAEEHQISSPSLHSDDLIAAPPTAVPSTDDDDTANGEPERAGKAENEEEEGKEEEEEEDEEAAKTVKVDEEEEEDREMKRRKTCKGGEDISAIAAGADGFSFSFDTAAPGSPIGMTPKFGSFPSGADEAADLGIGRTEPSEIGGEEK